jgi:hypothetical protein
MRPYDLMKKRDTHIVAARLTMSISPGYFPPTYTINDGYDTRVCRLDEIALNAAEGVSCFFNAA